MRSTFKRLVIAADDYGLSPAVSQGIRELAAWGRLSATGAMTLMPSWPGEAAKLEALAEKIDIGLHFTLTDQVPLGPMPSLAPAGRLPPIATLLRRSLLGTVPQDEVAAELERQLDAFEAALGRPPDFIDGHQHVHVLAGVRGAVLALFRKRLDRNRCWLRDCTDRPGALLSRGSAVKAGVIAALGMPLSRAVRSRKLMANQGFSGFYRPGLEPFTATFVRLLAKARDSHLLMMHPGHLDEMLYQVDSLTAPRQTEWDFLASEQMPAMLAKMGFTLTVASKSWQTPPP